MSIDWSLIKREFAALGLSVIHYNNKPNANGTDCWVKRAKGRPLSVEIKYLRKTKNGGWQVDPVSPSRIGDDLIAIIMNTEYVLIEPMKDHLISCGPKGYRHFSLLFNSGARSL